MAQRNLQDLDQYDRKYLQGMTVESSPVHKRSLAEEKQAFAERKWSSHLRPAVKLKEEATFPRR